MWTPGTPDVQLLGGDSKDGPMVAFAKFHNLSGNVTVGLGDPSNGQPAACEELRKVSKLAHSEYQFDTSAAQHGMRRTYIWRRTIGKDLNANYACLDAATGAIVAYFINAGLGLKKWATKMGELRMTSDEGPGFEQLLLVTLMAIREKENRNAWYTGAVVAGCS